MERSKDSHQTTPLIQHLIQKHEQKQLRAGGGGRGGGYGSEPKIIKKRAPGGAKDSDFNSYTTSGMRPYCSDTKSIPNKIIILCS